MKRSLIVVLIAASTLAGFGNASAGVMLGAHVGPEGNPEKQARFAALEQAIGRKLAIDNDHEDWAVMPDTARIRWDIAQHRLPMISWRIVFQRNALGKGCATADAILASKYDEQLDRQARAVKAFGVPILIRFNYEMTNNQENECFTGFRPKQNFATASAKYVAVWKHVVDRFRAAGATNAKWVWSPGHKAYEKGIAWALRALTDAPAFAVTYANLAVCLVGAGEIDKAKAAFAEGQKLAPEFFKIRLEGFSVLARPEDR